MLRLLYGFQVVASVSTQLRAHVCDCTYLCWHPRAAKNFVSTVYSLHLLSLEKQVSSKKFCSFFIPNQQGSDSCVHFEFTQNASQITFWGVGFVVVAVLFFSLFSRCLQVVCDNAEI